ncbi:microcystin degradation protein MlrC [Paraburkholderia caballeronis]|uniref:M81 family metallopeptidase n=1 Tax=Paraburkholderia caballeronis TaxID=416943 RepID=UPI00106583E8|nr:M81 family metallopeptidase [Paraburkholderia caballeronis]TDV33834.1 microcystin degradation protein MlrC [Paraburkholderia caballeronis]
MNIFVAGLMMETNSFSAIPCTRRAFEGAMFYRPEVLGPQPEPQAYEQFGYRTFLRLAKERGYGAYASLHAFAEPAAPCRQEDYESLRDEILHDLRRSMPVDMVFLMLHGAQMAHGYDDCEGDIIERVREIVGPDVFIGVELDLHGNISEKMLETSNALVACLLYPHTDFDERGEQLFELGERFARGEIRTRNYYQRVPMLGIYYTTLPRMAAVNDAAREVQQRDGVFSVSLMHGFPWANQPDTGAGVVIVADPDCAEAPDLAVALGRRFFAARDETRNLRRPIDDILDEIESSPEAGLFVIADVADNPGGGAGSDSTFILRRLLERNIQPAVLGMIWDPVAVDFAFEAGVGNRLTMRLGGKTGPFSGAPVDADVTVVALSTDIAQEDPAGDLTFALGRAALLDVGGVRVVANSIRQQVFDPCCFTAFGVDLSTVRVAVVKSTQHFHELFHPLAKKVFYCETPGALTLDFDPRRYGRLQRPMWPFDGDAAPA